MEDEEKRKEVDIISVAESIDFAVLEGVNLDEDKDKLLDRVEGAIRQSRKCSNINENEIREVAVIVSEMTAECQYVLGLGNQGFFSVSDKKMTHIRVDNAKGLYVVNIPASDILAIVEDLREGRVDMVDWVLASKIGHEAFHVYIGRNFYDIAVATVKANKDLDSEAYRDDPGEKACNVFGEKYADWREENRGQA